MYDLYIMRRTQIYLDERQEKRLAGRAAAEGVTKSAVIREAIDAYLADVDEGARITRFRAAVENAAGSAPDLPRGTLYVERLRALDVERQARVERRRPG